MTGLRPDAARASRALPFVLLAILATAARADVFSPGPLSRAHTNLEGLPNCTKCHVAGEQLSEARCLECHSELRARVAEGRGLHGRIPKAERACERCHHEHQGREFALVDWGDGGRKGFDHARAGFALRGAHRKVDCARCHDRRLVSDPAVASVLAKAPDRATLLGAPQACVACHFDEHRGQLGADCARCHGEERWRPAARFDHVRTAYRLDGAHAKVRCDRCHPREDAAAPANVAPRTPPVDAARAVKYRGVAFATCTDCHKDPHVGRFGAACQRCHVVESWRKVTAAAAERAFHEKTRYPLRGAHATAACDACHPPAGEGKRRYRGLAFARCEDCHADAHLGQLAAVEPPPRSPAGPRVRAAATTPPATKGPSCERCHGLDAWLPARFELEDHVTATYPLDGAHRTVGCAKCHPRDPALEKRFPAAERQRLAQRKRPVRVSLARLLVPKASDCRTCHADPHRGQLDGRMGGDGCVACHATASWRQVRFDHAKSRFPLTGKHAQAACASCHRRDAAGGTYDRPLPLACAGCHLDPHAGQLARAGETDCARCHETGGWKAPLRFAHAPPFTAFTLDGKHRGLACDKCHPAVRVGAGAGARDVRRYRPLPTACAACHVDVHKGAFRRFTVDGASPPLARPVAAGAGAGETRCDACHAVAGWEQVTFDHARTGFVLEGRHREVSCRACHESLDFGAPVPRACGACHRDVHAGRLGGRCDRCHEPLAWRGAAFGPEAHRRTAFPLSGRHSVVACDACHGDRRDRGFSRPTTDCAACHAGDRARANAVFQDHDQFGEGCRSCHGTWRFSPASFPDHDACFPIRGGHHSGIRCRDCHSTVPPVVPGGVLACTSGTADCMRCHSCAKMTEEHREENGFQCDNRRCYECHRFGSEEGDLRFLRGGRR
jgi:hypothetical protein